MRAAGWTEAHWRFAQGLQSAWPSQAYAGRAHIELGWAWLLTETGAALPNRGNFIPGPLGRPDKAQGALPSRGSSQDQQGRRRQLRSSSSWGEDGEGAEGRSIQGPASLPPASAGDPPKK